MKTLCPACAFVLVSIVASAQTATPTNQFGWTQPGQAPAVAQAATYNLYDGASTTPIVLTGVSCVAGVPETVCASSIPALTPGPHTVTLTQVIAGAESAKSNVVTFTFVVVVTPKNLTVK